ncbi:Ig-like domain-containing protein [Streptomyces sp. NPDC059373]
MKPSDSGTGIANDPRPTVSRRHGLAAIAALVAGGAVTLTACGGDKTSAGSGSNAVKSEQSAGAAAAKDTSDAGITVTPGDNKTNASIQSSGVVTVTKGTLISVSLKTDAGSKVSGTLSTDRTSWKPDAQLQRATKYTLVATAEDSQKRQVVENATFTTVSQANSFIGYFTPDNGTTVGVGMPVSFNFDKAITNKKAVQQAITVTTSTGQEVVGHWFSDTRLDFRPEEYWTAYSTITVKIALDGVEGASGIYGVQAKTVTFKIGRKQVSTADDKTKTMTVVRDGKTIRTIPVSLGAPGHTTYNGIMVMSEKLKQTRMNSQTVGLGKAYDIKDVPHAIRLTTSGTFVHGNYWRPVSVFGHTDTSHGCIGLHDTKGGNDTSTPAYWFYNNSLLGDVVIVKNSPDKTVSADNGFSDWNLSWAAWKAGSAV